MERILNFGTIRIEDHLLITDDGHEIIAATFRFSAEGPPSRLPQDAPGPGLRPDPLRLHAEALGDLLRGQQPVHVGLAVDALMWSEVWDCSPGSPFCG